MSAQTIESISEFLLHAGTNFQVFDMGRQLAPMDAQTFMDIENGMMTVPQPRQRHAWFGIVFWNTSQPAHEYIWFIKLPVDEQGLLVTASRNHFLQIIVDALGQSLTDEGEDAQTLPDNPYNFVPTQTLMAQFNAFVRYELDKPAFAGTDLVKAYLHEPQQHDWQALSMQAIADVALQLDDPALARALIDQQHQLAEEFLIALLGAAEAGPLAPSLRDHLCEQVATSEAQDALHLAALRALACAHPDMQIQQSLARLLSAPKGCSVDTLSVIAGRHFRQFTPALTKLFFEQAARADADGSFGGALFAGLFADLVQLPGLRNLVLGLLRTTDGSDQLTAAIGTLLRQTKAQ